MTTVAQKVEVANALVKKPLKIQRDTAKSRSQVIKESFYTFRRYLIENKI